MIYSFEKFNEMLTEKKSEKEEKSSKKSYTKEDEDKYLTAKQKKLPEALKAGIIKKAKKKDK